MLRYWQLRHQNQIERPRITGSSLKSSRARDDWKEEFLAPKYFRASFIALATTIAFSFTFPSWALAFHSLIFAFLCCLPRFDVCFGEEHKNHLSFSLSLMLANFLKFLFFPPFREPSFWILSRLIRRYIDVKITASRNFSMTYRFTF